MPVVFTHLRAFYAVALHGGFTAAAAALHVSQPTLTTQVRELEERHGVELFLRQGRRVVLSETGRTLFEISTRIMKLQDEADELLASTGAMKTGSLKFAAVSPFHATDMVARFAAEYPLFKVSMQFGNSEVTLSRIIDLEADIGILARGFDDRRVHSIPFSTEEIVVFVHRKHPWWQRESVDFRELEGQPLILREAGSTTRSALEATARAEGVSLTPLMEIGSREGVWKAVQSGLGIGVVAAFEFVSHPELKTVRIADILISTEYRLVFLEERRASRTIKAFVDLVLPYGAGSVPGRVGLTARTTGAG